MNSSRKENFLKNLSEDFRFIYDRNSDKHIPPQSVSSTAKKTLDLIKSNNIKLNDSENEGSGMRIANDLANKEQYNHGQLKRIKSFFVMHFDDYNREKNSGKSPLESEIILKWNIRGGDSGRQWIEQVLNSTQSNNKKSKKIRRGFDGEGNTKRMMDTTNYRIMREAFVNSDGDLEDFNPNKESKENGNNPYFKQETQEYYFKGSGMVYNPENDDEIKRSFAKILSENLYNDYIKQIEKWKINTFKEAISEINIFKNMRLDISANGYIMGIFLKKEIILTIVDCIE